ncbi:MAG: UDP-N-acetylglucosamine 1-carboxyvinyltransferase, partial [Acidimicrobiia bacterium]
MSPPDECCISVRSGRRLRGEVLVPGAKNSVLKLMAASLLADGTYELTNVPGIADVGIMADLLNGLGLRVALPEPGLVTIENRGDLTTTAPWELTERIRASINVLGPLLSRCGHVRLAMPGGDDFGS